MNKDLEHTQTLVPDASEEQPARSVFRTLRWFFEEVARLTLFCVRLFKEAILPPYELKEIIRQSYLVGFKSFPLIAITGFIMGLVLTIQSRPTLLRVSFTNESISSFVPFLSARNENARFSLTVMES